MTGIFQERFARYLWLLLAVLFIPLSLYVRFSNLSAPALQSHPIRETQTLLATYHLEKGTATVLDYRSPMDGKLWQFVMEFPTYQWIVSQVMRWGWGLEKSARLVTLFFFFLGTFFLYGLTRSFFGKEAALWTVLFYLISPYTVLFSRSCLIDFTALAFTLGHLYFCRKAIEQKKFLLYGVLAIFFGVIASVTKVTVWYVPAGACFIALAYRGFRHAPWRWHHFLLALGCLIPVATAAVWIVWSGLLKKEPNLLPGNFLDWFLGDLQSRWDPQVWKTFWLLSLRPLSQRWMLIPFGAGLLFGIPRGVVWGFFSVALISVLMMLGIHSGQSYYLIAEAPYLVAIAGVGMVSLFHLRWIPRILAFGAFLLLFAISLRGLEPAYATAKINAVEELRPAKALKKMTTPEELIYVDAGPEHYWLALYSERLVCLGPRYNESFAPNVFLFRDAFTVPRERIEMLSRYPHIWAESLDTFVFYRVQESQDFIYNPQKHVAVLNQSFSDAKTVSLQAESQLNSCLQGSAFRLIHTEGLLGVQVRSVESQLVFYFPIQSYLNLPARSNLGCRFDITPISQNLSS